MLEIFLEISAQVLGTMLGFGIFVLIVMFVTRPKKEKEESKK